MIDRLLLMLNDIDYRVRLSFARRVGVLFQTWDGHEELFQDLWLVSFQMIDTSIFSLKYVFYNLMLMFIILRLDLIGLCFLGVLGLYLFFVFFHYPILFCTSVC